MLIVKIKNWLIYVLIKMLRSDTVRLALAQQVSKISRPVEKMANRPSPYIAKSINDVAIAPSPVCERSDIVFITGRFRSGSTLVWNMFRQIPDITAYYEPLNERKWFMQEHRGQNVDGTHLGVDEYWNEYNGMQDLDKVYDENWIRASLYMNANSWHPKLKEYICQLIERAPARPVLQFNRVDFRLPWLRHHFPNARFMHLYRHPRDQWLSFLGDKTAMTCDNIEQSYKDGFYLGSWCEDLAAQFPFLSHENTPHPYQRFYYLWKLSYLYGSTYSDLSVSFEELVTEKENTTQAIIDTFNLKCSVEDMNKVVASPELNRWKKWADENWFSRLEVECEKNLDIFLGTNPINHQTTETKQK